MLLPVPPALEDLLQAPVRRLQVVPRVLLLALGFPVALEGPLLVALDRAAREEEGEEELHHGTLGNHA